MEHNFQPTTSSDENVHLETPSDSSQTSAGGEQPLTAKIAMEFLLNRTLQSKVCRYCLNMTSQLLELDMVLEMGGQRALYQITIRDMIAAFYPFQVTKDQNLPNKICECCLNRALAAYLFTQQCEQSERALRNYLDDVAEKVAKLDPLERKCKRGRQKINPNHDKIYVAHENVIDYAEPIIHLVNQGSTLVEANDSTGNDLMCTKCWQILPNMESLLNHQNIHPKSMWYHCVQCGRAFAKQIHLKKHVKSVHRHVGNEVFPISNDQKFECKTCGDTSENYQNYLQHIEKHKVKKALKHVLLENTNELCTICLDKAPKMVDLETRMSLNGSCPELNGDKSLYHIVGSTLPDLKQSYKYHELVVSNTAKILKICRKTAKTPNIDIAHAIEESKETTNEEDIFVFAHPIKMINVTLDFKGKSNTYTFSKPAISINCTGPTDVEKALAVEKESEDEDCMKQEKICEQEKSLKRYDLCKTCWIFPIPQCDKCVVNNLADRTEIENPKEIGFKNQNIKSTINTAGGGNPCNYCWLYKNLDKCDYCRKTNIVEPKDEGSNEISIENNTIDNFDTKKRTLNNSNPSKQGKPIKKLIWQCHVCLTTNDSNRVKCICCESNEFIEGINEINFGSQKEFTSILAPGPKNSEPCENELSKALELKIQTKEICDQQKISNAEEIEKPGLDIDEMMDINTESNAQDFFHQTTHIDPTRPEGVELMDVNDEENTDQEMMKRTPMVYLTTESLGGNLTYTAQDIPTVGSVGLTPVAAKSFKFNMGSGDFDNGRPSKRTKRPIRRNTSHK